MIISSRMQQGQDSYHRITLHCRFLKRYLVENELSATGSELRLETFIEVIENTGFDIIGGGVEVDLEVGPSNSFFNNWLNYGKYKVTKGSNGNCISREYGFYGQGLFFCIWKHQLVI